MKDKFESFLYGMIFSILIGIPMIILVNPRGDQLHKDRQEAVNHGYAQWVATTNGIVEFKWNHELNK